MSSRYHLFALLVIAIATGCQPPQSPQTPPSSPAPVPQAGEKESAQKLQTKAAADPKPQPSGQFSAEDYRIVSQKDEIISVLKNGLIVITKRVASPVAAVRGYAFTGGVYEGPWLGGGLSHLLEHLVAGGSNGRRTEEQNKELLQAIGNNSNAYATEDH